MSGSRAPPGAERARAAKESRLATRAFLQAATRGDCKTMRLIARETGADLHGPLARDAHGNDPEQLLLRASGHLTPAQVKAARREVRELPRMLAAAEAAKSKASGPVPAGGLGGTMLSMRTQSAASLQPAISLVQSGLFADKRDTVLSAPGPMDPQPSAGADVTAGQAAGRNLRAREQRMHSTFASLANAVVGERARDAICASAVDSRRLLRSVPSDMSRSMPSLAEALRSEELAVTAVSRRPDLLQLEGTRFKRLVPTLTSIFGGKEAAPDVAYAVSARPELLEVEHAQGLLDSFKLLCDCVDGVADARFMVLQTLAPASVVVKARSWSREEFVGEYHRIPGGRAWDRPVYMKPASSMAHLGYGRDMYLVFYGGRNPGTGEVDGRWLLTPFFGGSSASSPAVTPATPAGVSSERSEALAFAPESLSTPDQLSATWSFKEIDSGPKEKPSCPSRWDPDAYVNVVDSGRPRLRSLLSVPAQEIRECFDQIKEALCFCWRAAGPDGRPSSGTRLLGCHRMGDAPFIGSSLRFEHLGNFKHTAGYLYYQLSAKDQLEPILRLLAWDPITVILMYAGDEEPSQVPAESPPASDAKAPAKAAKSAAAPPAATQAEDSQVPAHHKVLGAHGFQPMHPGVLGARGVDNLPHLRQDPDQPRAPGASLNKPVVKEMFSRTFMRGMADVPIPPGAAGLPPLVFVKTQIAATSSATGTPCDSIKAADGELVFASAWPKDHEERRSSAAAPAVAPGKGKKDAAPPPEPEKSESRAPEALHGVAAVLAAVTVEPPSLQALGRAARPTSKTWPSLRVLLLERAGDLSYADFNCFRAFPEDASREAAEKLMVIESDHRFKAVVAVFHPPWLAAGESTEADAAASEASRRPPEWLPRGRWVPFISRTPVVLSSGGQHCPASFMYTRDFEPGLTNIPGAGKDAVMLVFWKRVGDPRPDADGVRALLETEPALLAAGGSVALLLRRLRAGFGDARARSTLVNRWREWAALCQAEDAQQVEAWLARQMAESLGARVGGVRVARRALQGQSEVASLSAPELAARCEALGAVLGEASNVEAAVASWPGLLALDPEAVQRSLHALQVVLDTATAQRVLRARPDFLATPQVLEDWVAEVTRRHPQVARERLRERTFTNMGEWSRWMDIVGQPQEALADWLGRLSAEERLGACQDRLHSFGGGGAAAPRGA